MNKIPEKLRKQLAADPTYKRCALLGYHECAGRITWEHAVMFKGKQLQERWAIIPICAKGHAVDQYQDAGTLNKEMNLWVALNRATEEDLWSISRVVNYPRERVRLNEKFGLYVEPTMQPATIITW